MKRAHQEEPRSLLIIPCPFFTHIEACKGKQKMIYFIMIGMASLRGASFFDINSVQC